ncbi:hypothetical protein PINS_up016924 [Pythium insidiosum]|nr:hypothetical protein PINS_up016924 [Pythium insidiosum]
MFPKIKLTYFKIDGRGSAVRAALHVAGIPFEDERIPFDETFHAIKHKFPFEKVPVLEVDGEVIAESQAMLRFVGRIGGLYPVNNPELALLIDEVLGAYDDMISMLVPSIKERDPQKKKIMREELIDGRLQQHLEQLDQRLQHLQLVRSKQIGVEPGLETKHDVLIHEILVWDYVRMFRGDFLEHVPKTITDSFKTTTALHDKIDALPQIREWLSVQHAPPQKLKLTYFDIRGRGEPTRLAMHLGGLAFEDERVSYDDFLKRRNSFPYGQLPVLDIDDGRVVVAQSMAILRYVGSLTGLYPTNNALQAFRIDEVFGPIDDFLNSIGPSFREQDPERQRAMRQEMERDTIPALLGKLDQRIAKRATSFAAGDKLTVADLAIVGVIGFLRHGELPHVSPKVVEQFPQLLAIYDRVMQLPKVQEYYAIHDEPQTQEQCA